MKKNTNEVYKYFLIRVLKLILKMAVKSMFIGIVKPMLPFGNIICLIDFCKTVFILIKAMGNISETNNVEGNLVTILGEILSTLGIDQFNLFFLILQCIFEIKNATYFCSESEVKKLKKTKDNLIDEIILVTLEFCCDYPAFASVVLTFVFTISLKRRIRKRRK